MKITNDFLQLSKADIQLNSTEIKGSRLLIEIEFKSGTTYCCIEPGCHFPQEIPESISSALSKINISKVCVAAHVAKGSITEATGKHVTENKYSWYYEWKIKSN